MAAPTFLFTPASTIYEVISASPSNTDFQVTFKYKISDRDTIPAWFYASGNSQGYQANPPGPSLDWNFVAHDGFTAEEQRYLEVRSDMLSAGWAAWKDEAGDVNVMNRTSALSFMQVAMKDQIQISSNYTIQSFYTYNTYRVNASGAITITLPNPVTAVQRHVNFKVDNAGGTITLVSESGTVDGASSSTLIKSDTIQTYYNDGTNWHSSKPVGFDMTDDAPVTTIRCLSQTQYNTLTAGAGADDNTLYLIKDE